MHENECLVYVIVARGVGASLILNGEVYRGAYGSAGEFGHTSVDAQGPRCDCGRRGCVEALVSEPRLLERAQRELGWPKASMDRLIQAAGRGEPGAARLLTPGVSEISMARLPARKEGENHEEHFGLHR